MSSDTLFSRTYMTLITADVKKSFPKINLREAWVYDLDNDHWEFHFGEFYWHGSASDAYEARANGWNAWLSQQEETRKQQCSCGHSRELHGTTSGACADCSCESFQLKESA